MLTDQDREFAYGLFYTVKGHLKPFTDEDLALIIQDYYPRVWRSEESYLYTEGFATAWQSFRESLHA